jgi:phage antirepressor YoqD-like protein
MQLAILGNQQLTMGTREIAEMLGKNHSDIKRSAYRLAESGVIGGCQPLAESPYTHEQNEQTYVEYRLNKRDSLVLVAQNCPEFTAAIVDRWQELEAKQAPAVPRTYAEALLEAGRLALEVERQAGQLALAAPKVEFVDKYVASTGNLCFRQVAKLLKIKENDLRDFMIQRKILYRLAGKLTPYADHIDAGRFEVKAGVAEHGHAYSQAKITTKGVEWLAGELAKHNARMAVAANDNQGW